MSNDLVSIFPGGPKNTISRKKPQKSKNPRKVGFPNDFLFDRSWQSRAELSSVSANSHLADNTRSRD